jgi:hypothetical protein
MASAQILAPVSYFFLALATISTVEGTDAKSQIHDLALASTHLLAPISSFLALATTSTVKGTLKVAGLGFLLCGDRDLSVADPS